MNTENVRDLLYDYVRGHLSKEKVATVEEQLALSKDLRDELHRVKIYFSTVSEVAPVTPPDNFLERVHTRIESSREKSIVQKLFFPFHIKIPFELAGVVATVMLVVYLFIPHLENRIVFTDDAYTPVAHTTKIAEFIEPELSKSNDVSDIKVEEKKAMPSSKSGSVDGDQPKLKPQKKIISASPNSVLKKSLRPTNAHSDVAEENEQVTRRLDSDSKPEPVLAEAPPQTSTFRGTSGGANGIKGAISDVEERRGMVSPELLKRSMLSSKSKDKKALGTDEIKIEFVLTINTSKKMSNGYQMSGESTGKRLLASRSALSKRAESNNKEYAPNSNELHVDDNIQDDNSLVLLSVIRNHCLTWVLIDSTSETQIFSLMILTNRLDSFIREIELIGNATVSGDVSERSKLGSTDTINVQLRVLNNDLQ